MSIPESTLRTLDDGALLAWYADERSQPAFTVLVERHAGMVHAACARALGRHVHLADDASQAVFLLLAEHAARLRDTSDVGPWLFRVTGYVTANLRRSESRRQTREAEVAATPPAHVAGEQETWTQALPLLNDAILALRPKQQQVVILHYLEGKRAHEMARILGCSDGAVRERLAYALGRLRQALRKRGVAVGAATLATGLASQLAGAAEPGVLAVCTATGGPVAMVPPPVQMLAAGARRLWWWAQAKVIAAGVAVALAAGGAGWGLVAANDAANAVDVMDPSLMPHYGAWRSSMIGGGGWIQNVVFTANPQCLYTYVDVSGFYRSTDGGHLWRMMHGNLPHHDGYSDVRGVSPDPRNPDHILVVCGNHESPQPMGIFLSHDGGQTFTQTLTARFGGNAEWRYAGFIIERSPGDPDQLICGSIGDGLFRSTDGGATWTVAGDNTRGFDFTGITIDRANPLLAWACAQKLDVAVSGKTTHMAEGFFASEDGGKTWRQISASSPSEIVHDPRMPRLYGIFDGRDDGWLHIRASDDRGVSWKDFSTGLHVDGHDVRGVRDPNRYNAIATGPDFTVVANATGDFFRLASGQNNWQPIARQGVDYRGWTMAERPEMVLPFALISSISIDQRNPDHWFFTSPFAIFETRDAARHWTLRMDGVEATVCHTVCQDPSDPGRVHLGMGDCGYFTSTDGGTSFRIGQATSNIKDVALSPKLPARVYAVGTGTWEWASNQVFVSIDGGSVWTRSPMIGLPDMTHHHCNTIAVNPDDPYECFLAVSGELGPGMGGPYHSTDGGKTWQWIGAGLPDRSGLFPELIWMPGRQIAAGPGGEVACVGNGTIYLLDRGAMHWRSIGTPGGVSTIAADPFRSNAWMIAGDSGIYRVADGSLNRVFPDGALHLAADMGTPGRFAADAHDGTLLSIDSGTTWTRLDESLPQKIGYNALAFAGDRLVVASGGSGAFWIPLTPAAANPVHAHPVTPVPTRAALGQVPALGNLDFSAGDDGPALWTRPAQEKGTASVVRDSSVALGGAPSLRLQGDASGSSGSVRQDFAPTFDEFTLSGDIRINGASEAHIAIQVFDAAWSQIDWIQIADLKQAGDNHTFTKKITLPGRAAHTALILTNHGQGTVWFGALHLTPSISVFR